jgi:two-component system response regulator FixJ
MASFETVHVVDDDRHLRQSMADMLTLSGYSVRSYDSADSFLLFRQSNEMAEPAIVISDVRMPGRSGVALLRELRAQAVEGAARYPVILLSGHANIPLAVQAMHDGAVHFLEKPVDPDVLLATVRAAFDQLAQERQADSAASERLKDLTPREREVLVAFVERGSNKAVANSLCMSPRTVEVHRTRIFRKSGAKSVTELVRIAIAAGLLTKQPNTMQP